MRPRPTPLPVPQGRRYWCHELTGKGAHHFRAPPYGIGQALLRVAPRYHADPKTDPLSRQERAVAMLPYVGAVVGAAWHHRGAALETPLPEDLSPESLEAYGERVADELQEADYDLLDLLDLFGAVLPEIVRRQSLLDMAAERATFSDPPMAASTTSSSS